MNGQTFGTLWVLIGLFAFGWGYNAFVAWLEKTRTAEPITWLLVVGGVLITIGGIYLLDLTLPRTAAGTLALLAFTASGTPMVLGSVYRFLKLWRQALEYDRTQSTQK